MNIKRIAAAALSSMMIISAAYAAPLEQKELDTVKDLFTANPRSVKDIGDPFVLHENGEYYTFATGGSIGFNVWNSSDLVSFSKSKALQKLSWSCGDYWAPEVFEWDGHYVMFYTTRAAETKSLRIGVALSDVPEGPYTDPIGGPLFDFGYAAIDGTLVTDDNNTPYLIYSRDCSENEVDGRHESHIYGVQLADDLLSTVGEAVLLTKPDHEWEQQSGDYRWNEGPAVIKHDGKYYLYYSANCYAGKEYSIGVAVAEHPLGPYTKQDNNPILSRVESGEKVIISGPGHNAFFTVGDELFTSYHTHTYPQNPSGNRQLCIDRAGFHHDGTAYINGPTLAKQLRPLADISMQNLMKSALSDDPNAFLLTDGDTCQADSSAEYVWHGKEITFRWQEPVKAEMLLIYAPQSTSSAGKCMINGDLEAEFELSESRKIGEAAVIPFEETDILTLTISFETEAALGEIMLLGSL